MKTFAPLLFLMLSFGAFAQVDQLDANGKKHGKWTVYLDDGWKQLKNSNGALYIRYTWYEHGKDLYPMGPCYKKGYHLEFKKEGNMPWLLNGNCNWVDAAGKPSSEHVFKDGVYISCKEYSSSGQLTQHFDYTKTWKSQEHTWCVHLYSKQGKEQSYFMRNGDKGWMLYECSKGDL